MKKTIYVLLALLNSAPSMATQNNFSLFSRVLVGIGLSALVSNKAKHDVPKKNFLDLNELDEKQVLSFILNNYIRKAKLKTNVPNELRGLIHRFFIHEWTIHGLHKETGTAYDPHGFDIRGIHKKTKNRLDPRGFKQNGYYKNMNLITGKPTKYDPQGYNIDRWGKNGLHENKCRVDYDGFAQHVSYASIALHKASKSGDIQPISLLLKHSGINVNLKDKYGLTPLMWCCGKGDAFLRIAKLLLDHPKIDVRLKGFGYTPLIWCCRKGDESLRIAKSLLRYSKIEVNLKGFGLAPLMWCCRKGDKSLGVAQSLLRHPKIDVNLKDKHGYTALVHCCKNGDKSLEIAKSLLDHPNIDVNLKHKDGMTALDFIIKHILLAIQYNIKYEYVNLWNVMVAKAAILNKSKNDYENLNPRNFEKPQKTYLESIISNPPRDLKINTFINKSKKMMISCT